MTKINIFDGFYEKRFHPVSTFYMKPLFSRLVLIRITCARWSYLTRMDTLSGRITLSKLFCLPSEKKGSTLKGMNLLWSKFFPLSADIFSEGAWLAGNKTRSHNSCLPTKCTKFP